MVINKSLLPIKGHYFLRYAGSAFMTMVLPLLVRQKGVSAQGIGFLWSTMPFVGLITNTIAGALADYFRAHRHVLLMSIIVLTSGLMAMYALPSLPTHEVVDTNFVRGLDNVQNKSIAASDFIKNMTFIERESHPQVIDNSFITTPTMNLTRSHISNITDALLRDMTDPEIVVDEGQVFLPDPKVSTGREQDHSSKISSLSYLMKFPQFWFVFIAMMTEQIGISTCVMMSDAVCFKILGKERKKYGQQRLWGTIGMGVLSIVSGFLVDLYSRGLPKTDYLPAVIICVVIMTIDAILVSKMNVPSNKGDKLKMGDVGNVLLHPKAILFCVTVFVMGTSLGFLWIYKLMYIEDVALAWDPNFSNLKLLQGLDLGIESFGGEIPFFFLSGTIIQRLGHSTVFAVSIGTIALRCCLYFVISNPWWFLPVEILNGISYGLCYACMASYASHLAPPGAQATLQSINRACMTVGMATAGFVGGVLYDNLGGAWMYLSIGVFDAIYCVIFIISTLIITKCCNLRKIGGNSGYENPSESSSTQTNQSSPGRQREEERETRKSLIEDV